MKRWLAIIAVVFSAITVHALDVSNRYRSPRNPERKVRQSTELIVLHTTEAPAKSSLNKVSDRGECHFVVSEDGTIYRIVDRDREAFHAGRSMWKGREDVDKFSIGIECVGYHDKPMGMVQLRSIAALVKELKKMYRITDDRVVCHSHVAYGAPNKWQRRRHRGRKRCGMLFAMPSVRKTLGLVSKPAFDADTRAGRLAVGDKYLERVLYGRVDTMVGKIGRESPQASGGWLQRLFNRTAPDATASNPASPNPAATVPTTTAARTTTARTTAAPPVVKPAETVPKDAFALRKMGYKLKGVISKDMSALRIAGAKWNSPTTYYTVRQQVIPGTKIDPSKLAAGTGVWMK